MPTAISKTATFVVLQFFGAMVFVGVVGMQDTFKYYKNIFRDINKEKNNAIRYFLMYFFRFVLFYYFLIITWFGWSIYLEYQFHHHKQSKKSIEHLTKIFYFLEYSIIISSWIMFLLIIGWEISRHFFKGDEHGAEDLFIRIMPNYFMVLILALSNYIIPIIRSGFVLE